jgi:hypothetical protein
MSGRVLAWSGAILAGLALGSASAWAALALGASLLSEHYGAWAHRPAAGAVAADPYTRAIVASEGLLALTAREALYFTLERDGQGRPLDESCSYTLTGGDVAARWWSVTLYAGDDYLAQNSDNAHSIDATGLAGGAWSARVSPTSGDAANWLSSRGAGRGFSLSLRVYQPRDDFRPSPETLPVLTTSSCATP